MGRRPITQEEIDRRFQLVKSHIERTGDGIKIACVACGLNYETFLTQVTVEEREELKSIKRQKNKSPNQHTK